MKQRYKMILAYDGTNYAGWQIQPAARTIQGELEDALFRITGERERIHASGRTDAGVHAAGQVAHFDLLRPRDCRKLRSGLHALVDRDLRVTALETVDSEFHARLSALGKEYRYFVWNDDVVPPFHRHYRTRVAAPLDVDAMRRAADRLVGEHDFAAFSANPSRDVHGTVRHVRVVDVARDGDEVCIRVEGNGFLYKMVRSLAGFLIRVGAHGLAPSRATDILASRVRTAVVPTAPPEGLFLWEVRYESGECE